MRPPESLTTSTVDTSITSKHFSSTVAKRRGHEDNNAHSQSVSKHHQQVDELDVSRPGFREVPANVTRITAGTRSAAAPPPNQPHAAPLNQRRPPTRKPKKKNQLGDNSDSGSDSDNTNRLGHNDDYSASRRPEAAPEVPEADITAEYPRHMRQKGFDWMLRSKKAEQKCEEFHEQCARNRDIGREGLEILANDPRAFQLGTADQLFKHLSADLCRVPWNHRTLSGYFKIWESRRRAHFDKVLYSYFQASLGNDCPMETPIDMFDTLQSIVEAVDAEMVHCLGHFNRSEDSTGTDSASASKSDRELICNIIQDMYRSVEAFCPAEEMVSSEPIKQKESLTVATFLKQKIREVQIPETSTVGRITRAYVDKIIALIENNEQRYGKGYRRSTLEMVNNVFNLKLTDYEYKYENGCSYVVRRIATPDLEPIDYLSWILDASDRDSLLVFIRNSQWKQNQKLRDTYRIRQEMFHPGDSRPGFCWSVLWSWNQPKIIAELSRVSMRELGWFYEESEEERYFQYQRQSAYLNECESTDGVVLKVSMTKKVVAMYLYDDSYNILYED